MEGLVGGERNELAFSFAKETISRANIAFGDEKPLCSIVVECSTAALADNVLLACRGSFYGEAVQVLRHPAPLFMLLTTDSRSACIRSRHEAPQKPGRAYY